MAYLVPKSVTQAIPAVEQKEGVGAKIRRALGNSLIKNFTPFLMLDHFKIPPDAGFPDHPHRGQETITYMIKGHVDHEDFTGSKGSLGPGDLQFMTAGKGIVHAEMPRIDKEDGDIDMVEGLQLWVDLPMGLKHCPPRYRDLRKAEIPVIHPTPLVEIKVISGESYGVESSKDLAYTPVWYFDMKIQPGGKVTQPIPQGFNTFIYLMAGEIIVDGKTYEEFTTIFFSKEGTAINLSVPESAVKSAKFILVSGMALDQPIVQHGPFVETTKKEIIQAFIDYQSGRNGFERAIGWESAIGQRLMGK